MLYNAGGGIFKTVEEASLEDFEANWKINVQGLVAATKAALPQLRQHDTASIIVTSASAATRGGPLLRLLPRPRRPSAALPNLWHVS
jgi:NADP-dependent 3-hydroxy acid dehydrogenase YdfG